MARRLLDQRAFNQKLAETLEQTVNREIVHLTRRLRLLSAVQRGDVKLRELTIRRKVMTWTVRARARTYVRRIAPKGFK